MLKLNNHKIEPTIFPDKTSQVWKIDSSAVLPDENIIEWEFEHEGEIMHLAQLVLLIDIHFNLGRFKNIGLHIPYLPYGRQDKHISNNTTFALQSFVHFINSLNFSFVKIIDPHSWPIGINGAIKVPPTAMIQDAINACLPNDLAVAYPDAGAAKRYDVTGQIIVADKIRDPQTGKITSMSIIHANCDIKGKTILIVDDICDGGATFITLAHLLDFHGAKEVNLFTTHGIYSKGLGILRDAGIKRIFNRKGEEK